MTYIYFLCTYNNCTCTFNFEHYVNEHIIIMLYLHYVQDLPPLTDDDIEHGSKSLVVNKFQS